MTIDRINIDGKISKKQDFLDLIIALQSNANFIRVSYREGRSIATGKSTEYLRDNQGRWWMIRNKGVKSNQRIRVVNEGGYFIQYI